MQIVAQVDTGVITDRNHATQETDRAQDMKETGHPLEEEHDQVDDREGQAWPLRRKSTIAEERARKGLVKARQDRGAHPREKIAEDDPSSAMTM